MKVRGILYRIVTLCAIAIVAVVTALPGISQARTLDTPASAAQTNQPSTTPLSSMLNPDGTINVPKGFTGSLDPKGFRMDTGPKGEPHFTPSQEKVGTIDPPSKGGDPTVPPTSSGGGYQWDTRFRVRGVSGGVWSIAVSGSDVYIGGYFTSAGNVAANSIARWDGSAWHKLGSGTNEAVLALAVSGSNVYAAGQFTQIGGVQANYVARWNGSSWSALGSGTTNGVNDYVHALAVIGSNVYVGGYFTQAGSSAISYLARWNGTTWAAPGGGVNGPVLALAANNGNLYVGGAFTTAGGSSANNIAMWNGTTWLPFGNGLTGSNGGTIIRAIAISGSNLYATGEFSQAGGQPANNIARWDGSNWFPLGSGLSSDGESVAVNGSTVYVGGYFDFAGGQEVLGLAQWDGSAWSPIPGWDSPFSAYSASALAAPSSGPGLYIGGNTTIQGIKGFMFFNGVQMVALASGKGVDGDVDAIVVQDTGTSTQVYIGGNFNYVGDLPVNNIARWDGAAWNALGSGVNGTVITLAANNSNVFAGGSFTQAGGQPANRVARWNGSAWSALGIGHSNGVNGSVYALALAGNILYAGGSFTQASGLTTSHIARWNGSAWSALSYSHGEGVNGSVYAIAVSPSYVYVGGIFSVVGGIITAHNIARWNGIQWSALGGNVLGDVFTIAVNSNGTHVYVGGRFQWIDDLEVNKIAMWNATTGTWSALGTGVVLSGFYSQVYSIAVSSSEYVYVGGNFDQAGNVMTDNLATWYSGSWSSPGSGGDEHEYVAALAIIDTNFDTLFLGGNFSSAGTEPSYHFARRYFVPLAP